MLMPKIAFRNLFRQKRRSLLTALTMLGGFVLAAVSIGWSDGSYNNVIDMFTRSRLGHIQVHAGDYLDRPSLYKTINDPEALAGLIAGTEGVASLAPRLYSAGLASVGEKTTAVRIVGIDPVREDRTTRFNRKIVKGRPFSADPSGEAMLGKGLAEILDAAPGDEVVIVSQGADGSIANDAYSVVALVESGDEPNDRSGFYLPLAAAQELLVLEGRVHEIVVTVENPKRVRHVTGDLRSRITDPGLTIEPWQEFARTFYIAMRADRRGMWIMLFIIMLIVAVGVLNTVLMTILERRREYGLLLALGTKPRQLFRLILLEINCLALGSILAGSVIALIVNYFLSVHGVSFSESFTYGGVEFGTMYAEINLNSFLIPAVTVILTASLVALFPALKAIRTDPARSMRIH